MANIDPVRNSAPTELQTSDCIDCVPAGDTDAAPLLPAALSRRCVYSQDLPRFSRTSLQ